MTSARIQTLCKKHNINKVCFDVLRINSKTIRERNIESNMQKTNSVQFDKLNELVSIKQLKK